MAILRSNPATTSILNADPSAAIHRRHLIFACWLRITAADGRLVTNRPSRASCLIARECGVCATAFE